MKSRRPLVPVVPIVLMALAILIGALVWYGVVPDESNPIRRWFGGGTSSARPGSSAAKHGEPGGAPVAGRIVVTDSASPAFGAAAAGAAPSASPSAASSTGTLAADATGADPKATVKAWQRALAAGSIETNAQDLVASTDANDWLRLASLHMLCQSGIPASDLDPARATAADARYGAAYRRVAANIASRCGEFGQNVFVARFAQLESRAIEDRASLALAPSLNSLTLTKGMTDEELQRLSALFADGDLATLWLARNVRRLDGMLLNANDFSGTPREDLQVASVYTLCLRGIDCGASSLLTLQLCAMTRGAVCATDGITAAVQQMPVDRSARINNAARSIDSALSSGNLLSLGIRIRPKP